jgi:hypothetical protein
MTRETVLAAIDAAFGPCPRPATLVVNPHHCDECADHEATMQAVTPQTLTLEQVGSPAWDPVCFLSAAAFCYFMPGLARLALGTGEHYYLDSLLFHLEQGFRIDAFTADQRRAVHDLLDFCLTSMLDEIDASMDLDRLGRVLDSLA